MDPSATGATTETWRQGSRAAGLDRWSSTTTPSKAARASCSDHEVWVRAPALTTTAAARPRAPWTASIRVPSWLDWTCSTVSPSRAPAAPAVVTWSARVAVP